MNPLLETLTSPSDRSLAEQVQSLVARLRPEVTLERRHDDRVAVPFLFRLTPLDSDREPVYDDATTVVGKDISRRGLSFFHERPLTYRRAIISLEHPEFGQFAAEIDINWCRFTRPGWYESGGRLVRATNPEQPPILTRSETTNWAAVPTHSGGGCC